MEKYFISYSHDDSDFVNELVLDLKSSNIPVTYDKWELNIGDSIINKISDIIDESIGIIPIISKNSITSNWVTKELSLAMTAEIGSKAKVFPIKIDDCLVPTSLRDKLYSNLGDNYYWGLWQLIRSIKRYSNSTINQETQINGEDHRKDILNKFIQDNDKNSLLKWIGDNKNTLLLEFGSRWHVSEIISGIEIDDLKIDYMAINGQSWRYDINMIIFGKLIIEEGGSYLVEIVKKINDFRNAFSSAETEIKKKIAVELESHYAAEQILYSQRRGHFDERMTMFSHDFKVTLVTGRRADYTISLNDYRDKVFSKSDKVIEIASYNRIIDSINR